MQRSGGVSSGLLSVFREAQGRRLECSGVAFALHARGQRPAYFLLYMIAEVAGGPLSTSKWAEEQKRGKV